MLIARWAEILQKLGRNREAIAAYEKSLKLALAGQESLHECPMIAAERSRLNDEHHFEVYLRLGELYLLLGENDHAGQYLRMATAARIARGGSAIPAGLAGFSSKSDGRR